MKWMNTIAILLICSISVIANDFDHEKPTPYIKYLNTLDGLSTFDINTIDEDRQGRIWFGNKGGAKGFDIYDGKKFEKWSTVKNNYLIKNALKSHQIKNGKIWILYQNFGNQGSLAVLEPIKKEVHYHHIIKDQKGEEKDLKQIKFIDMFFTNSEDAVYLLDNQKKLYKLTLDKNAKPEFISEINSPIDASKAKYAQTSVYVDSKETLWLSHGFKLFMKKESDVKFKMIQSDHMNKDYIINRFYQDNNGKMLILTNFGLFTVHRGVMVPVIKDSKHPINKTRITAMYHDELGNYWLGTWDGLYRSGGLTKTSKFELIDKNIKSKVFNCITGDSFGGIWFSVKDFGVGYIDLYNTTFGIIRNKDKEGKSKNVNYYFKDSKNREWILTSQGLSVRDLKTGKKGEYKKQQKESHKTLPQTDALGVFETSSGEIWVYFVNLYLCRVVGNDVTNLHLDFRYLNMNIVRNISGIEEDENGVFWVSSVDKGVASYNPKSFKLDSQPYDEFKKGSLSIVKDPRSNKMWFSTSKKGVFSFEIDRNSKVGKIENFKVINQENKENLPIRFLQFDEDYTLWGGNRNKKVFYKKDEEKEFTTLAQFDQIKDPVFNNIKVDGRAIWIVGDHLNYFDLDDEHLISFSSNSTKNNLFSKYEINQNHNGDIFFCGSNGVLFTNKKNIKFSPYQPKVFFNGLQVNGDWVDVGEEVNGRVLLSTYLDHSKKLELAYAENEVAISVRGIYPPAPNKITYKYRLKKENNKDQKWLTTKNEDINFGSVVPGTYEVEIFAEDHQGNVSKKNVLSLKVKKPWWMYPIVWVAFMILFMLIGIIIYKSKVKQHKEKAKLLENIVQERTKEIQMRNEELHQQSEELEQQRDHLFEANQTISTKNELITQSLNYAKTIQETILPIDDQMESSFTDHFVYYRPKDIVSGDFYWMAKEENKTIIACVDCTGHGVPGALMSMVGNAVLNQIVKEKKIFSPKVILEELDSRIKKILKQEKGFNDDGMDLSICCLERQEQKIKLTFSGAKNDLYYARSFENEVSVIKGTKRHIGGKIASSKEFEEESMYFLPGDRIYLFTDGIIDLHNGERRRFGRKRLIELVENTLDTPVSIQGEKIVKHVEEYSENQLQRDDITFMAMAL
ncbi:SpoIIE family protein phosphatase [Flammeovirga yaeyamensis]|uniref:SpoIIE family protein phosphatase n=1 Tax=Flammeovirga yaeyamensis TaxID=367791 RepID=A0AAX1NBD7_9BACT|nr:SpoIIE family protein phosphatase [Flammeovirga yaeyamensis]MBB3697188.1 serine phosphatase RsbU (regulator of sigma subunit)/ligand-binding sensor domain-containing protein [Flammeovirga yaeyamensis]NMF33848.1 SpoIIE family protein phosphatase [Flammeovirga yaeyamensis]QWG04890.1 SpoIIE family protein phosphatase [Flammeovirga yaeyamensis]